MVHVVFTHVWPKNVHFSPADSFNWSIASDGFHLISTGKVVGADSNWLVRDPADLVVCGVVSGITLPV